MSKPPLWEVMIDAHAEAYQQPNGGLSKAKAAEIRAVRDWLVPEGLLTSDEMDLRALLTAEADRAERGERGEVEA